MIFLGYICGGWAPLLIKTRISVLKRWLARSVNNKTARTPGKRERLFLCSGATKSHISLGLINIMTLGSFNFRTRESLNQRENSNHPLENEIKKSRAKRGLN